MCLRTCEFALERKRVDGEMMFVGTGYKVMSRSVEKLIGKWTKAKPWNGIRQREYSSAVDSKEYFPGFHIWQDLKDAVNYHNYIGYNKLYKVTFAEVISYGTNGNGLGRFGNCIVANWIKYEHAIDSTGAEIK